MWFRRVPVLGVFPAIGRHQLVSQRSTWFASGMGGPFEDDDVVSAFEMQGNIWIHFDVEVMTGLRAAIVIEFSIDIDSPAWDGMRSAIRADRAQPIVFGIR